MPRKITTMMGVVAAVAVLLGVGLAVGRWYGSLSAWDRAPIDVARAIFLGNAAASLVVLGPPFAAEWVRDRATKRAADRRAARGRQIGTRSAPYRLGRERLD